MWAKGISGKRNNLSSDLESSNYLAFLPDPEQSGYNTQHKTHSVPTGVEYRKGRGRKWCEVIL